MRASSQTALTQYIFHETYEDKDYYLYIKYLRCGTHKTLTRCKMFAVLYFNYRIHFYHNFIVTVTHKIVNMLTVKGLPCKLGP